MSGPRRARCSEDAGVLLIASTLLPLVRNRVLVVLHDHRALGLYTKKGRDRTSLNVQDASSSLALFPGPGPFSTCRRLLGVGEQAPPQRALRRTCFSATPAGAGADVELQRRREEPGP